jgi:UDP-glucose 4-epimerase
VITIFVNRLLRNEAPIIHGDGKQTRDFIHVDDVVSANMLASETKNAVGKVLNIASGATTGIGELARMLQRLTNKEHLKLVFTEQRPGDIRYCLGDISRAKELLGFQANIRLQDGLSKLIKWCLHTGEQA